FRFRGRRLACLRAEKLVFAELDLAFANGEAVVLEGANGSGKSSLLRLLAGLLPPSAGDAEWQGAAACRYLGHGDAVNPALSGREALDFWRRLWGGDAAAVAPALAAFDLMPVADVPARMMSAGQRRRLALARLALVPAPVWLLDEPTIGLDSAARAALERALAGHLAAGGAAVLATHVPIAVRSASHLSLDAFRPDMAAIWAAAGEQPAA
ncbi:MAG: heme ABC exporter ATP-binding protein CcmA, partial [Pseudomonadota bacterium]|nr:heme ABC exporter ATP-binding protein CcmA [Pseudomonadota bacterium]